MKRSISTILIIAMFATLAYSQDLTQIVRGTVIDADSKLPLINVNVVIIGTDTVIGTITDVDGNFRLENILIGRIDLQFSYMGYEDIVIPNIEVNSGKEVVLDLKMRESALKLDEVIITTGRKNGEAINEFSLLSARSISVEEIKRYTGGMDDPARMATSYAGVTSSDGSSDIIVRGNSPKYMQWRLDGVEISSPYRMDDQNAKVFLAGGQRYLPLLRDSEGNVAVDPSNNKYWDYDKAYDNDLVHVYNVNLSVSYKINRSNSTHEIFLDLMNIINGNAKLSEYYDESKPDKIGYSKQMTFLPNIMYRVYF